MSGKYQAYPEYKDSGIEWLGNIPSHWVVTTIKRFAPFSTGWTPPTDNDSYFGGDHLWANISDLGPKYLSSTAKTITDAGVRATRIRKSPVGSLLFSFKLSIGLVSIVEKELYTNEAIATFEPSKTVHVPYMYWAAPLFIPQNADENIYGAKLLNQERISNAPFVLPPRDEQRTIAAFLDHETARIDRLIEKQQRLIELLKEKRQAVISHAVTKGLDPNVPMKDSGVEWLGQVPEHWVVTSLKYFYENLDFRRIPLSSEERGGRQGEYPYYGASGVIDSVDDYLFDEGCVLVGEDGANLVMRSTPLAFVAHGKYWVNNHAHILRMNDGLNEFWAAVINNIDIRPLVSGSAQPKLTAEAMGNITIACSPNIQERRDIMRFLEEQLPKIDVVMHKSQFQIALLKERRTALISAAVTGKIDVRNWQPDSRTPTAESDLPMAAEQAAEYRVQESP